MRTIVFCTALLVSPVFAAGPSATSNPHASLNVQSGHWIYRGTTVAGPKEKAGSFTWDEHCGWSANRLFLMCSFDNDWSGKKAQSLVVDSWNAQDKTYWHYEMFASGGSGAKPFVSRMTINGNTWTEYGEDDAADGSKNYDRIVYVYTSANRVKVSIEVSKDGRHWTTYASGEGVKQP
jgi:hypothetical protein